MKPLIAKGIELSYGDRIILRGADLSVSLGERVGLVGANGCGKSSLVKILMGDLSPDHGVVNHIGRRSWMAQDPVLPGETVRDCAADALAWHQQLLDDYARATDSGDLAQAARLQDRLDDVGWEQGHRVDAILDRLNAPPPEARIADLSGGERRRLALGRALLSDADVLILDEPTNHLDVETVIWLESYLAGYRGAVILVTHDRVLLESVANRIVEIEDGKCISYDGSYTDYLISRAEHRSNLVRAEGRRQELLAREAAWASRAPSARRTKQKARLQRLEELRSQRSFRPEKDVVLDLHCGEKFGGTLLDVIDLHKGYGDRSLMRGLNFSLNPGERLGILGPNGAGKSTLLRLIQGLEDPDRGEVLRASRSKLGVLDQGRTGLKETDTVFEAAGNGNDHVKVGEDYLHVASFLNRFLFSREYLDQSVSSLSGGERARLLLARLLLRGSSLLLLDEPTNDLDLLTLRVLEEAMIGFDGAAIVVTHDRAFLDRVCTGVLAFEGNGQVVRYASRGQAEAAARARTVAAEKVVKATPSAPRPARPKKDKPRKLTFKEQQELKAIPARIEDLEDEQGQLAATLSDPGTYQRDDVDVASLSRRMATIEGEVETLYAQWSALEAIASA